MKVKYGDLSGWLKAIVIISWVIAVFTVISFVVGFIAGFDSLT